MAKKGTYAHICAFIFRPIGARDTIKYRLVIRNQSYDAYIYFIKFFGNSWQEMGKIMFF